MKKYKFFKIYTGDYSKNGYDDGINDAKRDKPKSGFGVLRAVHPLNYVWKLDNSYDSYSKNYNKGYLDGQRVKHQIYSTNQQKGESMGFENDSYENHLRMLGEVRHNLASLNRYIIEKRDEYKRQIDTAKSAGFLVNYINPLKAKYDLFSKKIDNITSLLKQHDNYLKTQEENIQRLIELARQVD